MQEGLLAKYIDLGVRFTVEKGKLKVLFPKGGIEKELLKEIKENKDFILAALTGISNEKDFSSILATEKLDFYELSSTQRRLFIFQELNKDSVAYNVPITMPVSKDFDRIKIEKVLKIMVLRHESFRTRFKRNGDVLVQQIVKNEYVEVEEFSACEDKRELILKNFVRPFDLSNGPLLRAGYLKLQGKQDLLMFDMHHIISDGISCTILAKEFEQLFTNLEELPPLKLQYKDYCKWQNQKEQKDKIKKQETSWLRKFEKKLPILSLPTDYPRSILQNYEGKVVNFTLNREETEGLKLFTKNNELTLYMSVLSIYSLVLSKLSGQDDILIGTPIAGRNHVDLEKIVGVFINTLVIRNDVNDNDTVKQFISKIKQTTIEAFENQDYLFENLVEKVSSDREMGRNPIFDVMFNLLNHTEFDQDLLDSSNNHLVHNLAISKFDLTLTAADYGEQIMFRINYSSNLFKEKSINRFINYFKYLVNQINFILDEKVSNVNIIPNEEKQQLLYDFNKTESIYPKEKAIHQVIEEQAVKNPNNISCVYENEQISYLELNNKANNLAHFLKNRRIGNNSIVSLFFEPSIDMLISIIGVLKSGAVFLPIISDFPEERVNYILLDSGSNIVLKNSKINFNSTIAKDIINVDKILDNKDYDNLPNLNYYYNSAYIIYTSGTTGKPKGVVVSHQGIVNYIHWFNTSISLNKNDNAVLTTNYVFDAIYTLLFGILFGGGKLNIIKKKTYLNPKSIIEYIDKQNITLLKMTPTLFNVVINSKMLKFGDLNTIRFLMLGGEAINSSDVEKFHRYNEKSVIMNHYGPTETTVGSVATFIDCDKLTNFIERSYIGKPINNTEIFILNKCLQTQPIMVSGELFISGDGLALGYMNNLDLTLEKFIDHPLKEGAKLYRTGDLARWLPDGNIEFLGRVDHQVKIRGHRVELSEIEKVILSITEIKEVVVVDQKDKSGDKALCAYVVYNETNDTLEDHQVISRIRKELPQYMIPGFFVTMQRIPMTVNGKVDREKLPLPQLQTKSNIVKPRDIIEREIVEIWSVVLGIDKEDIGVYDSFFEIGGNSIKIMQLSDRIGQYLKQEIDVTLLFERTTVSEIVEYIKNNVHNEDNIEEGLEETNSDQIDEILDIINSDY